MAEVSDIVIKKTQDSLGKIIKKPVLTDKLLRKPPFKFLHDVIHAIIKTTGYLNGLYSDNELLAENIKDRDSKILFLQKLIDVVKLTTKQEIRARPSKIVAGLEADKTNELLQAIAKAIDQKIDSTNAVAAVKSGKSVVNRDKEPKQSKVQTKTDPKNKKPSKTTTEAKRTKPESNQTKSNEKKKSTVGTNNKISKQSSKDSVGSKDKELKRKSSKENNHNGNPKAATIELSEEKTEINQVESTEIQKNTLNDKQSIQDAQIKNEIQTNHINDEQEKQINSLNDQVIEPDQRSDVKELAKTVAVENIIEHPVIEPVEKVQSKKPRSSKQKSDETSIETHDIEKSNEIKSSKLNGKITKSKSSEKENEPTNDIPKKVKPETTLRSAALRPVSARPSAPRRRDRNVKQILHTENFIQYPNNQNESEKKSFPPEFDDADNIVITNVINDDIPAPDALDSNEMENELDGTQGHLVQQILKTRTTILKSDSKTDGQTDENLLNEQKSIGRTMTELGKSIQKLTLYITPLGKMMEYFQEDVDAMQIELSMWQKAYATAEADIKEEKRQTEELLEQFKYQLAEINNNIKDQIEQINNSTMNILQNEDKISKLISTL